MLSRQAIKCVVLWEHRGHTEGLQIQVKAKRENREAGKEHFKVCDIGNAASLLDKIQGHEVEMDDTGIKRGKILESFLSCIKKPSKVEVSNGLERNILVAIGESGGGLEVNILLATVVERNDSKCLDSLRKVGRKA